MPQSIAKHFQSYENDVFRMVEGQYFITTRKLVDSDEEQKILEDIIEQSKPIAPLKNSRGNLHYLLFTPFRYPPLKSGGRFHTKIEQSIFYCSEDLTTTMAEIAYHRFLFMQHTTAKLDLMEVPYTHFKVRIKSKKSILLHKEPFLKDAKKISNPTSYVYSQNLGKRMRDSSAELFTYVSARRKNGINIGIFSPEAFQINKPIQGQEKNWGVFISADTIEFRHKAISSIKDTLHCFHLSEFFVNKKFPIL